MSLTTKVIDDNIAKILAVRACGDDESIEVVDYNLENYSKSKIGFLGNHQRLEIRIKKIRSNNEIVKLIFFVKSVPRDSHEQMYYIKQRRVYNQEAEFFNEVMPQLLEVVASGKIEPWAPKCYLANEDIIVLEDVGTLGFATSEGKILEGEKLKGAVRTVARFHAASILLEEKLGKPLNQLYPQVCMEQIFNKHIMEYGIDLIESLINDVAKRSKRTVKHIRESIKYVFNYINKHDQGNSNVLCHGDVWANNIMLDSSEPQKCLLVDYQLIRYVPRMVDVAQLIYLSTTKNLRKSEEMDLIEIYWEELCETLRKCNPSIERPSLDTIKKEYDSDVKLVGQFLAVMYFPSIFLSKEILLKYQDNSRELYTKYIFRSNNDSILELMDKDEEYATRITEAVLEFIENCEKPRSFEKI